MNGISTKFNMRIYHANNNVQQQFRKLVIKIWARAWWWVTRYLKGISTGAIANLPYQVKGFDCFCSFQFDWYLDKIYHRHSTCQEQRAPAISRTCDINTSEGIMMGNPLFERNFKRSNSKFTIPGEGIWLTGLRSQSNPFTWYGKFAIVPVEISFKQRVPIIISLLVFLSQVYEIAGGHCSWHDECK